MHVKAALLVPLLASSLIAQKTCFVANETQAGSFLTTATATFCLKENSGPNAAVVTAADFYVKPISATTTTIVLYSEDPTTLKPQNLLASANVTLVPGVEGWYGAVFPAPATIAPNTNFFVGVGLVTSGLAPMLVSNGPGVRSTPHWFGSPAGWNGPFASAGWKYRVYCGTHRGAYTSYGTGKAGTGQFVPLLLGQGWPNTGNQISLNLSGALNGAPALLLWGTRANLPLSLGTLYVSPIVLTTVGTTAGTGPGLGYQLTEVVIPLDPSLAGARVAFQSWIVDAGATSSVAHTNGVEALIGN